MHCGIALNAKFIRSTQTKPESISSIKLNWIWCSVSCNLAKRFWSNGYWWPYVEPVHKQCHLISTVLLNIRISSKTHLPRFGHWQTKTFVPYVRQISPECAGEIWAPQSIGTFSKVESLQWRATKCMLNLSWTESTSYQDRLIKLKLLPILFFMKSMIFFSILLQVPIRSITTVSVIMILYSSLVLDLSIS